jgi:hypothetical protein
VHCAAEKNARVHCHASTAHGRHVAFGGHCVSTFSIRDPDTPTRGARGLAGRSGRHARRLGSAQKRQWNAAYCNDDSHVTARRIAQPPKVTFVARLRPGQLPSQAARQLPDLSTSIRVRSSLTDDSRLRGRSATCRPYQHVAHRGRCCAPATEAPPTGNTSWDQPLTCRSFPRHPGGACCVAL